MTFHFDVEDKKSIPNLAEKLDDLKRFCENCIVIYDYTDLEDIRMQTQNIFNRKCDIILDFPSYYKSINVNNFPDETHITVIIKSAKQKPLPQVLMH